MPRIILPLTAHGRAPITRPTRSMVRNQRRNNCAGRWLATASHVHNNLRMAVDFHACSGAKLPATMRNGLRITVARWPCNAGHQIAQVFLGVTFLATRAWLRPVSQGNRHFTVGGGRFRQSGPRPDTRLLHQPAPEGLTRSARTDYPRRVGRNRFRQLKAATTETLGGGGLFREEGAATFL
ncbi:hypothetical protein F511_28823 [Dorcoceras hygrometricum]|uniref:Uncharacterized protein n=1 Tax=Dorcoceras hygrometricum TaxID=472368 RepID=A0A2Z7AKC3_9LAMI|nr:hypothetical protein F511_28823 [Dorcoceras hygrometricum]